LAKLQKFLVELLIEAERWVYFHF